MRAVPDSLDPEVVATIDERLDGVERDERVHIPWAIESGSRAWGFPSPDSDYDCRFLYLREPSAYLSLWPQRDVIETPLDAVFDVNGWDVAKAIRLIAKGNATAIEWLRSPIVYRGDESFRDQLLAFAEDTVERAAIGRHYLHVTRQQSGGTRNLKRFFYSLRPAAALRWLEVHPSAAVPPMDLMALLDEGDVAAEVRSAARHLVVVKSETREMGSGAIPDVLREFVTEQLERAETYETAPLTQDPAAVQARADALFRNLLAATPGD